MSEEKTETRLARILRLAKIYGPFVRFTPEGNEGDADANADADAKDDANADANTDANADAKDDANADADANDKDPETVPYERFKEVEDMVKQLQEAADVTAQQDALRKANPVQGKQPAGEQFDIYKEAGLDPDDPEEVIDQSQLKKILNHVGSIYSRQLADLSFLQAHPDYAQLVGTVDEVASGKYAGPFAMAIKKNPALLTDIAQSNNPRLAAYNIAKLQVDKGNKGTVSSDEAKAAIDEAVKNANRIKSSSNAKGGAALSEEGRLANMSDKDFVQLALGNGAII